MNTFVCVLDENFSSKNASWKSFHRMCFLHIPFSICLSNALIMDGGDVETDKTLNDKNPYFVVFFFCPNLEKFSFFYPFLLSTFYFHVHFRVKCFWPIRLLSISSILPISIHLTPTLLHLLSVSNIWPFICSIATASRFCFVLFWLYIVKIIY